MGSAIALPPGFEIEQQPPQSAIPAGFEIDTSPPKAPPAQTPSLMEGVKRFQAGIERQFDPNKPLLDIGSMVPQTPGVLHGAADFAGGLTTPQNLGIMAATGGLGAGESVLSETAAKLVSLGFSSQMIVDAVKQVPAFATAAANGDVGMASEILTKIGLGGVMGALGLKYGVSSEPAAPTATDTQVRDAQAPYQAPPGPVLGPAERPVNRVARRASVAIPATGPPEGVARGQAAREDIAQQLTGKSWAEISPTERNTVDSLIAERNAGSGTREAPAAAIPPGFEIETQAPAHSAQSAIPAGFEPDTTAAAAPRTEADHLADAYKDSGMLPGGVVPTVEEVHAAAEQVTGEKVTPPEVSGGSSAAPAQAVDNLVASYKLSGLKPGGVNPTEEEIRAAAEQHLETTEQHLETTTDEKQSSSTQSSSEGATRGATEKPAGAEGPAVDRTNDRQADGEAGGAAADLTPGRPGGDGGGSDAGSAERAERVAGTPELSASTEEGRAAAAGSVKLKTPEGNSGESAAAVDAGATGAVDSGGTGEGGKVQESASPGSRRVVGEDTDIPTPGEDRAIRARYEVRELADIQPSHRGQTFSANPKYPYTNERDYSKAENQQRVIEQSSEGKFDPRYHITDNPDATNGPPVLDDAGNALGGNSRTMTLQRVYGRDGAAAAAYRALLEKKAAQFGIDPETVRGMKQPVLVRTVPDSELESLPGGAKWAIRKTNVSGMAALSQSERSAADAGQLHPDLVEHISKAIDAAGPDATLNDALTGKSGTAIVNRLIAEGFFSEQERPALMDGKTGALTQLAKDRIGKAMLGKFFRDSDQIARTPLAIKAKLERIAAPLAKVQSNPAWDLTPAIREAVDLVEYAGAHGIKNLDDVVAQRSMFDEAPGWKTDAVTLAKWLRDRKPNDLMAAARGYVNDREPTMFGETTPAESFAQHFGGVKAERPPESEKPPTEGSPLVPGAPRITPQGDGHPPPDDPERGGTKLDFLTGGLMGSEPEGPAQNYSGLGATKDKLVRNLSQLEKADPAAHAAAVKAATSRAQTAALIRSAAPRVIQALGKDGPSWTDFRRTLMESRLRGIRARWQDFAAQTGRAGDSDLKGAFGNWMVDVLKNIHEDAPPLFSGAPDSPPQSPAETAAALLDHGDFGGLRAFASGVFDRAAGRVARVMPDGEYSQNTANPGFQKGLRAYKDLLEQPIARNHESNEGVFSDALGPLDTYYPLVPVTAEDQLRERAGRAVPYRKPGNIANAFATGSAAEYDPGMEAFADRLRDAFRVNNKAALHQTLQDQGLLRPLARGEASPETITYQGKDYKAVTVEIKPDRQVITQKGSTYVPPQKAVIPAWLEAELRPILDRNNIQLSNPKGLMARITKFTLSGPLDAVIHSSNLMGTLVANTPFLGRDLIEKAASNIPYTKRAAALFQILTTDPMTEGSARDIGEMAKLGLVPEKYGSETYSRQFAEETGAELHRTSFGPVLYGPKGIDIRARLVMYRLAKAINPDATPTEQYLFVNQLGNYTRALQGSAERSMKESGWSPFYTAGSTMVRNGINAWTGQGPRPKGGMALKALQAITGGAAGTVGLWALTHKAYTGVWPQEDKRGKFLQIRANAADRNSALGHLLWGPASAGDGYFNFGFFSPVVSRGARALGIAGAYDAHQAKGSGDQIFEAALAGAINAAVQPAMGPPAKAAWLGLTGTEPYLTGMRDDRANPSPQFLSAVKPQKPGMAGALKQHVIPPLVSMNSFFGNVAAATGLSKGVMRDADDKSNHWLRMVTDLAAPQLVSRPSKTAVHAQFLAKQRTAAKRASEK